MRIIAVVVLAVLAGAGYWYFTQREAGQSVGEEEGSGAPTVVVAKPVQRNKIVEAIEALGTTQANESVTLTAKVSDIVSRVNFEDGDYVEQGKVLVELANDEQSALLAEARANLQDVDTQLRRLVDLGKKKLVPDSDIDEARAQAAAARARLDSIAARMDDRLVRAPFSGLLGFRQVSPGTLLTNDKAISTLDDISVIKLDFSIPEVYLHSVEPGYAIQAGSEAWPGRVFSGKIRTIGSRVDPVTRAVTVRALIANDDRTLRPGMLLTVKIITAERMSLVVPESAVTQVADDSFVFLAGADGKASKASIRVGARRFGFVEVLEGLSEGDKVITEGSFKIREGSPIRIQDQAGGIDEEDQGEFAAETATVKAPG
jgi:membrane fusion protein (multidrug efflux system)